MTRSTGQSSRSGSMSSSCENSRLYNDLIATTKGQRMTRKPSTRLHEVIDTRYRYTMIVHCGSQNACHAWVATRPAKDRQHLEVRVAKR